MTLFDKIMANSQFKEILLFVGGIIILLLMIDKNKQSKEIQSLKKEINDNADLTNEIKKQLNILVQSSKDIDPKISNEIAQIVGLLEIKQSTTAVLKLAKIIENLLIELYAGDNGLKDFLKNRNHKNPTFADYIEFARIRNIITGEDYHMLSVLKIIRNEEAHELDVKKEKFSLIAAFITGVRIVFGLSGLIHEKALKC
jgi:hypothetical protein